VVQQYAGIRREKLGGLLGKLPALPVGIKKRDAIFVLRRAKQIKVDESKNEYGAAAGERLSAVKVQKEPVTIDDAKMKEFIQDFHDGIAFPATGNEEAKAQKDKKEL